MRKNLITRKVEFFFWMWVDIQGPDECWEWQGFRFPNGYGECRIGTTRYAHRATWILVKGEIPPGIKVLHECDNPPCCNPKHLWLGTSADNAQDMVRKGRHVPGTVIGDQHWNCRLSDNDVRWIRNHSSTDHRILAAQFSVDRSTISNIVRGRARKHVKELQ